MNIIRQARRPVSAALFCFALALPHMADASTGTTIPSPATLSPSQALINQMATEPWRYGAFSSDGQRRVVMGLRRDGENGIAGEYALLDGSLRPQAFGTLHGTFDRPTASGMSVHCRMTVPLPDRVLTLDGTCGPDTLTGSVATRLTPTQLASQMINFLGPDASVTQYWLTAHGFDAAFRAAPTP